MLFISSEFWCSKEQKKKGGHRPADLGHDQFEFAFRFINEGKEKGGCSEREKKEGKGGLACAGFFPGVEFGGGTPKRGKKESGKKALSSAARVSLPTKEGRKSERTQSGCRVRGKEKKQRRKRAEEGRTPPGTREEEK